MKLSDAIKYSYIKIIRDKKNIYFVLLMSCCSFLLIISIAFMIIMQNKINYDIKNDIGYRTIYVFPNDKEMQNHYNDKNYDYGYDKIMMLDHINEILPSEYRGYSITSETFKSDKYNGAISLIYGSKSFLPEVVYGRTINPDETGVAICPINFYPSITNNLVSIKKEDYLDGKNYLNSEFTIQKKEQVQKNGQFFENDNVYKKKYEIVGLYDNKYYNNEPNACFISPKDIKELYDLTLKKANENNLRPKLVIVDSSDNTIEVLNNINNMGFDASMMSWFDYKVINTINAICITIFSLTVGGVVLLSLLYLKKSTNNDSFKFGMLKSLGYQEKSIQFFNIFQLSIQVTLAYILSLVFVGILLIIVIKIFGGYLIYINLSLNHNVYIYFLVFIVLILLSSIASFVFTKHKLKYYSLTLLKESS